MANVIYTPEQQAVLDAEGKIIVSASAGSGKTFVMIERMLKKILAGAEVERMLALTFTKKAAAQMREKIQKSLINKLNEGGLSETERAKLKKQLLRLPMAEISTIHSFCSHLIRSHFFLADVDGAFEVISTDDASGKSLKEQAMEEVFAALYEEQDEDFLSLLSIYYRRKKDDTLRKILFELYDELRVQADYRTILENSGNSTEADFERISKQLYDNAKQECVRIKGAIEGYLQPLQEAKNVATLTRLQQMLTFCDSVLATSNYYEICALPFPEIAAKERVNQIKDENIKEISNVINVYRESLKKFVEKNINGELTSWERAKEGFFATNEIIKKLAKLLLKFDDNYTELKREGGKLDYNDLEHIALKLLSNERVKDEMHEKFDYVFVDEYQDINPVQEQIISLVGGENIFLVGDVKQSIYAFRGSKSIYFSQKQREFESVGQSLYLTSNFRSASAVLSVVNDVFSFAMNKDRCDVNYAENPMHGGAAYGDDAGRVCLHLVPKSKSAKAEKRGVYSVMDAYEKHRAEVKEDERAKLVLDIINAELHSQYYNIEGENKGKRAVRYGDIAILVRKKSTEANKIIEYLTANGIPVAAESKVNLFTFPEIRQLVDIIYLLDNPEQDIPLCSALLSGMGGLNNADLAKIKERYAARKDQPFRALVKLYATNFVNPLALKIQKFYTLLDKYAVLAQVLSAGELLERLIGETGMETYWLSRKGGNNSLSHIRAFVLQAQDKNLHDFIDYLKNLDGEFPYVESGGENAVKIVTMHASKGLEYPVVILPDLSVSYHGQDYREVYYSQKYGILPKYYDSENKIVYETAVRRLYESQMRVDEIKDELNILYVAMTRAKYAMHLLVNAADYSQLKDVTLAGCYADLLPMQALEKYLADEFEEREESKAIKALVTGESNKLMTAIREAMDGCYENREGITLPVKSSASEMLHGQEGEYYATHRLVLEEETLRGLNGVDKTKVGTAYHAFLQYANFAAEDGEKEFERLVKEGKLSLEDSVLIDGKKAGKILAMPVFKRLQNATLYREQPFMVQLPACEMFDVKTADEVLFQGFIDLLAQTERGVEIVDYKYSSRTADGIRQHYAPQIKLYKKAVAKIMRIDENTIRVTIINIQSGEEIDMNN